MPTYTELVRAERRLEILRALEADPDYEVNEGLLGRALELVGLAAPADAVAVDLAWLEEQGLVTLHEVSGLLLARLTRRGVDAALGRTRVPGIARPRPEA